MEKKYKIVLLGDDLPKKVLFKSNVKRNIQQKFKKLGKSTKPLFTRKYVKRKICQFYLGLFCLEPGKEPIFIKDSFGRNVEKKIVLENYFLIDMIPYEVEESIYNHQNKKRISFLDFCNHYLSTKDFTQIFTLNNKIIIQREDVVNIFSLKNIDDTNRLVSLVKDYMINHNKMNFLIVQDYDTIQRKQLYTLLTRKGYKKSFLYKHYTY